MKSPGGATDRFCRPSGGYGFFCDLQNVLLVAAFVDLTPCVGNTIADCDKVCHCGNRSHPGVVKQVFL